MLRLESGIRELSGVGDARAREFSEAGFFCVEDLLFHLPTAYREPGRPSRIADARPGVPIGLRAVCERAPNLHYGARTASVSCIMRDASGTLLCVWYGQPYLARQLVKGREYALFGRPVMRGGQLVLLSPAFEDPAEEGMLPVYAPVGKLKGKVLRNLMRRALEGLDECPDALPGELCGRLGLPGAREAFWGAHFPQAQGELDAALRRLAFENLALFLCAVRDQGERRPGLPMRAEWEIVRPFIAALPYDMTRAQARCLGEILGELSSGRAMARLLQGDVGSGKTVVALAALFAARQNGYQGALMAPTEILALQHEREARELLEPLGVRVGLLVGSMKAAARRAAHEAIASGTWDVVVGTHALLSRGVSFAKLGLAIVDEQHRFGVRQRESLAGGEARAHMLVLSATPIPRSLALVLRGDLKVSLLDEMPPGRGQVRTRIVPGAKERDMYGFLAREIQGGRQVFAVCPRIEEDEDGEAASVEEVARAYEEALPGARVGVAHGKLRPAASAKALEDFRDQRLDVLVATTLIEVGVHVPNATVMVIHDAPFFGLSTLHQLRGRVGRGADAAYCLLLGDTKGELESFAKQRDGFAIAQLDLERRGPGELLGQRQHGRDALPVDGGAFQLAAQPEMLDAASRVAAVWSEGNAKVLARARRMYGTGGYAIH